MTYLEVGDIVTLQVVSITKATPSDMPLVTITDATNLHEPEDILVDGDFAYVPCRAGATLTTIGIANILTPAIVGVFTDPDLTQGMGVAKNGNTIYLASWANHKLLILDAADPTHLTKIASIVIGGAGTSDQLRKIFYSAGYVYAIHCDEAKLYAVDVGNSTNPSIAGSVSLGSGITYGFSVLVSGDYAYCGGYGPGDNSLKVISVLNKAAMSVVKTLTAGAYSGLCGFSLSGTTLYSVSYNANYFIAFNVADPPNAVELTKTLIPALNRPNRIHVFGTKAYVPSAPSAVAGGVVTLEISNPTTPVIAGNNTNAALLQCYDVQLAKGKLLATSRVGNKLSVLNT